MGQDRLTRADQPDLDPKTTYSPRQILLNKLLKACTNEQDRPLYKMDSYLPIFGSVSTERRKVWSSFFFSG